MAGVAGAIPPPRSTLSQLTQIAAVILKLSDIMAKLTPGWQKASVLESVFDQLSDALVLYDPEFTITGVNQAVEKLFGMSSEEMLGKHCQEIFRCAACEPGCGVLTGLNQSPSA